MKTRLFLVISLILGSGMFVLGQGASSNAALPAATEETKLSQGDDGREVEAYSQTGASFQLTRTPAGKRKADETHGLIQLFDKNGNRQAGYLFKGFQIATAKWADEKRIYLRMELGGGAEGLTLIDGKTGKILYSSWISP
ncbi:MAG: hypothetical protein JNM63_17475 [Spirochaetia bacterium]|nr:hypothetical protein [Spirochaetia bacterium]